MTESWFARQGWGPADLEANRAGKISDHQLEVVRARNQSYVRRALWFSLPLPVASLVFAIVATVAWNIPELFVLPIIGFLPASILLAFVAGRYRAVKADLDTGVLAQTSGTVDGWFLNNTTGQAVMRIGGERLQSYGPQSDPRWKEVRHCVFEARRNRSEVCAYFLARSKLVIAAEEVTRSSD